MPLYAPGAGPHKTTHENAGTDEIDATGLTGVGGGATAWADYSTDGVQLDTARVWIYDQALDAGINLDVDIVLAAPSGHINLEPQSGEVVDIAFGDGLVMARLAGDPASAVDGQVYYNTATDKFRGYVNGAWENITAAAGAHNTTHQNGGADEISIAGLDGTSVELAAHIADAADAHDASAVSFDDTGLGITAADVQTMGEQLDAAISAGGIPATIVDAKGDSIWATAADTVARVAAGANGTVPTYASGATAGMTPAFPPGYELDYAEFTSAVSITSTVEATPDNVVSGSAVAYDGSTTVMIEFYASDANTDAAVGRYLICHLWDGATELGIIALLQNNAAAAEVAPLFGRRRLTPTAATHTYHIKAHVSAGSGAVQAGAGGTGTRLPGYIRITKV